MYIAITKTGSSTLRYLLDKYSDITSNRIGDFSHHITSHRLKDVFTKNNLNWDDYLKFTVSRHPISRIYSKYKYQIRLANNPPTEYMKTHKDVYIFYEDCVKFKDLNLTFEDAILSDRIRMAPQTDWILSSDQSKSLLDKIIKIEHIAEELPAIWNQLKLPLEEIRNIPILNKSPSEKSWESVLSNEAIDKLETIYANDFKLLNY